MNKIYVVGHKNPDTDAIVSAMAYAALRNASGDREYEAARLDHCNDETKRVLAKFGFEQPTRIKDVRTQVRDIDYDTPSTLDPAVTMYKAWNKMQEENINTIPVIRNDGTLYGTLSASDIANYNMNTVADPKIDDLPLFNLLGVIEGNIINEGDDISGEIKGEVVVALPGVSLNGPDLIVCCGNQPDIINEALEKKVNALIICGVNADLSGIKPNGKTCIIYTPFDCAKIVKLIYQAMPVSGSCNTDDVICFHLDDYVDDVREIITKSRFRSYPILDENEKVVGTLSRYHLLTPHHKRVVLMDHNESSQAVNGLEQAEILEIIDHHRLADIQTTQPIHMRNEPVGSTTTIVSEMYQESGVMPSPQMAGLMVAAILSDTVMFKSPTCTKRDIAMAERLSKIAGISTEEVGTELFSSTGSSDKTAEQLIKSDFKEFHIAGQRLGVGQITCVDSKRFLDRKAEFMETMETISKKNGYDFMMLMITDVLIEGSHLIYIGNDDTIKNAFNVEPSDNQVFLPGVMSRKKQIIPMLTALWG